MDYDHLQEIRNRESEIMIGMLTPFRGGRLLEIGAGAGWQASKFAEAGFEVSAVDLASSQYLGMEKFPSHRTTAIACRLRMRLST